MFDKTQYIIEMTLGGRLVPFSRDTYSVKDAYGNLLGYAKKQRLELWPKFWFEGTDGTRMGEIRSSKKRIEVYDAQNRLRATIREKPRSPSKKRSLFGVILFVGIILFAAGLPAYMVTLSLSFFVIAFLGVALAVLGGYYLFSTYERPEWHVETPEGKRLAEIKQVGRFFAKYKVLAPDGDVIAHIHKKRGLSALRYSYTIDITRQILDPRFIISYAILRADMDKAITSAAPTPALVI